jgi:class 3 adenylate cyclase/tetratricopeptide (TPR) repeat protein
VTGERRHLTVLFCDLAGSTTIATQLDPEEWRETVAGYQRAAADAITRFGGHVAKYLGDGVMAFFGWPEAHDNDAERAARAGLAILDAIARLNEQPARPRLTARIGIDSGPVVVGAGAGKDADVFGDAPNIAARAQEAAAPGTVVATEDTHRLIAGLFVVEDRGAPALKGVARPIRLYRIIRPSGAGGRFKAMAARGLTPFVGRGDELRLLLNRWERALDGEGQVALLVGEAGIGKSRLVHRFHEQIAATPHAWIEAAAAPFFQNTPFYPVSEALRQMVWEHSFDRLDDYLREMQTQDSANDGRDNATHGDESAGDRLAQLRSGLTRAGLKPAETLQLIAPLLSLPLPAAYPALAISPEQQRRRLLAALIEFVLGAARAQPLVLTIEDLHWADPSTLELIQLLAEQTMSARLLLLFTARPEFRPQWPLRAHHTQINLNRLSGRDVHAMVEQVAAQAVLSRETLAAVVERTGGVPLFVEELTRAVLESGAASLAGRAIPATLHDSLMARLDRLGPAKEVLQIGAVIGAEFSYELLHAVHPIAEPEFERALRAASDAELLYVRGIAPDATYQFKHALIRDAAYEALLKSRRRELHKAVAQTIDDKFPALRESHPELLARHWTEAGETERATNEWSRAARTAEARNAVVEAEGHYRRVLMLLRDLPQDMERDRREFALQIALGKILRTSKSWSHPDAGAAFTRAQELGEKLGETNQLTAVLLGLGSSAVSSGQYKLGREFAERMLLGACRGGSRASLCAAHTFLGQTLIWRAQYSDAQKHLDLGNSYYDEADPDEFASWGIDAPALQAIAVLMLGFPDRSCELMNEALRRSERRVDPFRAGSVHMWAGAFYVLLRNAPAALEHAQSLHRMAAEQPVWTGLANAYRGQALLIQGNQEEARDATRKSIAFFNAVGLIGMLPWAKLDEAECFAREGQVDDALTLVTDAIADTEELTHLKCPALRQRATLLARRKSDSSEIEAAYRDAIECARTQSARYYELQAAIPFARLLASQNRRDEARTKLAEIYGWFTEGFDTADLKEAKALLDELNG